MEKIYAVNIEKGFDADLDLMMPIHSNILQQIADECCMEVEDLIGKNITIEVSSKEELNEASIRGLTYAGHSEEEAREIVLEAKQ